MDWEGNLGTLEVKVETKPEVEKPQAVVETKTEETPPVIEGETRKEEVKTEPVQTEAAPTSDKLVPQEILGKVLKAQREKFKSRESDMEQRLRALEDENKRLKSGESLSEPDPMAAEIAQKVREEFLMREDAYGREKYGQQYKDALELIAMQNDPILVSRIQSAAKPADTLISEAVRIAEELEFGATPEERQRKKEEMLKEKIKKELEAELAEKIKAKTNQPTDVQNVRSAGGDVRPIPNRDTWASGRGSLPR